jgi:hypothetical protein
MNENQVQIEVDSDVNVEDIDIEEDVYELHRHVNADGTIVERMVKRPKEKPNLLKSAAQTAKDLAGGGFAPGTVSKARLDICLKCEYLSHNVTCNLCGCFMEAKTRVAFASCPKGKWGPTEKTGEGVPYPAPNAEPILVREDQ